jgi:hypothetical protein
VNPTSTQSPASSSIPLVNPITITAPNQVAPPPTGTSSTSSVTAPVGSVPVSSPNTVKPPASAARPNSIVSPTEARVSLLFFFDGQDGGFCDSTVKYDKDHECSSPKDPDAYKRSQELEQEAARGEEEEARRRAKAELEMRDTQILAGYACYKQSGRSESARNECKDYVRRVSESPMYLSLGQALGVGNQVKFWLNIQQKLSSGELGGLGAKKWLQDVVQAADKIAFVKVGDSIRVTSITATSVGGGNPTISASAMTWQEVQRWNNGQQAAQGGAAGGSGARAVGRLAGTGGALITLTGDTPSWIIGNADLVLGALGTLMPLLNSQNDDYDEWEEFEQKASSKRAGKNVQKSRIEAEEKVWEKVVVEECGVVDPRLIQEIHLNLKDKKGANGSSGPEGLREAVREVYRNHGLPEPC